MKLSSRFILSAIALGAFLALCNFAVGNLDFPGIHAPQEAFRPFAASIAFPCIIACLYFASLSVKQNALKSLGQYHQVAPHSFDYLHSVNRVKIQCQRHQNFASLAGIAIALTYMYSASTLNEPLLLNVAVLKVMSLIFWSLSCLLLWRTIKLTQLLRTIFPALEDLDINNAEQVTPFSHFAIRNIVLVCLVMVLIPLFWVGRPIPLADLIACLLVLLVLVTMLVLPVVQIQFALHQRKQTALSHFNKLMSEAVERNICGGHEITDNPRTLHLLANLINDKNKLKTMHIWPFKSREIVPVILIATLAPISLFAGSIIQYLLS